MNTKWNHAIQGDMFIRVTCPVCGSGFNERDRSGAFDDTLACLQDRRHYSNFFSLFADSVTIMGKRFNSNKIDEIEAWLDEVGNPEYKGRD